MLSIRVLKFSRRRRRVQLDWGGEAEIESKKARTQTLNFFKLAKRKSSRAEDAGEWYITAATSSTSPAAASKLQKSIIKTEFRV